MRNQIGERRPAWVDNRASLAIARSRSTLSDFPSWIGKPRFSALRSLSLLTTKRVKINQDQWEFLRLVGLQCHPLCHSFRISGIQPSKIPLSSAGTLRQSFPGETQPDETYLSNGLCGLPTCRRDLVKTVSAARSTISLKTNEQACPRQSSFLGQFRRSTAFEVVRILRVALSLIVGVLGVRA